MRTGIDPRSPLGGLSGNPPPVHRGARRLGLLLLAVHLGLVVWAAFRPISAMWMADTNLTPFASIHTELVVGTADSYLALARGLLLLAPLGLLLPLAGGRLNSTTLPSFLRTVFAGVLIATGVEVLESALTSNLLNVDDVLLAAVGIAVTHIAVVPAARAALRRRERSRRSEVAAGRPTAFGVAHSVR